MEPITDDHSLHKLNMSFVNMESENWTSTELWLKRSFWLVGRQRHEHLQAQILDYDFFFKGLYEGTIPV